MFWYQGLMHKRQLIKTIDKTLRQIFATEVIKFDIPTTEIDIGA